MMRRGLEGICLLALVGLAVSLAAQGRRGAEESLSVEDYTPRSTLVVPEHPVPRAKFPVIDVHSHHRPGVSGARWETIIGEMAEVR